MTHTPINPSAAPEVVFHLRSFSDALWTPIFSNGFGLSLPLGDSIRRSLCGHLGIPADYLDTRIQTVFLNFRPVDDLDAAILHEGDVLSLSAAMPGLAGATMRRGGFFSGFRHDISYDGRAGDAARARGRITLKLFNTVGQELGRAFLSQGVFLKSDFLSGTLAAWDAVHGGQGPANIEWNGEDRQWGDLTSLLDSASGDIRLTVKCDAP